MNGAWNEAVIYAREQLDEVFTALDEIGATMSPHDMDVSEILTHLNKLSVSDLSWVSEAQALSDLVTEGRDHARRRAQSTSGSPSSGLGPYILRLRSVLLEAAEEPAAFDAARHHAAKLLSNNMPMCYELKSFACGVLRDEVSRPVNKKPKVHEARDAILYGLLFDITDRFAVKPTRNRASVDRMSACDILAEAMPNKANLPKSYSSLERIWFEGQRTWERDRLSEEPDLF